MTSHSSFKVGKDYIQDTTCISRSMNVLHTFPIWKAFDSVCWLGCASLYTCETNLLVLTCWHRQLGLQKYKLTAYKHRLFHLNYVWNLGMQHIRWKEKCFLLDKHCIAIDKNKSCEHKKQKLWFLRPSQISVVILDSNNNESKGDTVIMVEERGFKVFYLSHCYNRSVHPCRAITQHVQVLMCHTAPVHLMSLKNITNRMG